MMKLNKIKILLFVLLFSSSFLFFVQPFAHAIPTLQLDIAGGTYDYSTKTIIASTDPFTLYAYLIPDFRNTLNDDYYISAALIPKIGPTGDDLGSFSFGGTKINVTSKMTYGVPPLEIIVALQGWDAGDLPKHESCPTYFYEFKFNFSIDYQISSYNTQDRAINGGAIPTNGSGMYYAAFVVNTSSLDPNYVLHFDLYNTKIKRSGDIDVTQFAPFSHDAQSTRVPEPSTLLLLGSGLIGLAIFGRKRLQK